MAATSMQFDLVTPERSLASLKATAIDIPGSEGDMTVMPDHAPVMATLRPGFLKVQSEGSKSEFMVSRGFVEITGASVAVLSESVLPSEEATRAKLAEFIEAAETEAAKASGQDKDLAEKRLGEFRALESSLQR